MKNAMSGYVHLDSLACHKVRESIKTRPKITWFFVFRCCDRMLRSLDVGCQGAGKDAGADAGSRRRLLPLKHVAAAWGAEEFGGQAAPPSM